MNIGWPRRAAAIPLSSPENLRQAVVVGGGHSLQPEYFLEVTVAQTC